jgi:hypothetical protein
VRYAAYYTYTSTTSARQFSPRNANTTYRFRVRATNGAGTGPWSTWSYFEYGTVASRPPEPGTTTPPPSAPSERAAARDGDLRRALPGRRRARDRDLDHHDPALVAAAACRWSERKSGVARLALTDPAPEVRNAAMRLAGALGETGWT